MLARFKALIRLAQVLRWRPPAGVTVSAIIPSDLSVHALLQHGGLRGVVVFGPDDPWFLPVARSLDALAALLVARAAAEDAGQQYREELRVAEALAEAEVEFERGMRGASPDGERN